MSPYPPTIVYISNTNLPFAGLICAMYSTTYFKGILHKNHAMLSVIHTTFYTFLIMGRTDVHDQQLISILFDPSPWLEPFFHIWFPLSPLLRHYGTLVPFSLINPSHYVFLCYTLFTYRCAKFSELLTHKQLLIEQPKSNTPN